MGLIGRLRILYNSKFEEARSKNQFYNIVLSFIFKSGAILCNFLLVPLTIDFLNISSYGIWITISSMVAWISFLDGGLANGLKNKLSESLAKKEFILAQTYISTAYMGISIICLSFCLIFFAIQPFLNWYSILNIDKSVVEDLASVIIIVFSFFCLKLILEIINSILASIQKVGLINIINFIINLAILIATYLATVYIKNDKLIILSTIISIIPVVVLIFFSFYLFQKDNILRKIKPRSLSIHKTAFKDIYKLGVQFFLIQIATLVIFATDNFIILHLFDSHSVSVYNIAFKYFSIVTLGWNIIITPYWTAFNEAYTKNDYNWLEKTMKLLFKMWIGVLLLAAVLLIFSNFAYRLWINDSISIPFSLSCTMFIFILVSTFNNILAYFINGIGKIRIQFIGSIIVGIANIPLCYLFAKTLNLGISGVMIGTICSLLPGSFICFIQYKKIIQKTDKGIWGK